MSKFIKDWKKGHKMWSVWAITGALILETFSDFFSDYIPAWGSIILMLAALCLRFISQPSFDDKD